MHIYGKTAHIYAISLSAQASSTFEMFDLSTLWKILVAFVATFVLSKWAFIPPAELNHLPKVPILALLWSYASGEVEEARIKRLILPFANEKGEGVVLVYSLGRWIVHVLDIQVRC